jgi:hypothetical protein
LVITSVMPTTRDAMRVVMVTMMIVGMMTIKLTDHGSESARIPSSPVLSF